MGHDTPVPAQPATPPSRPMLRDAYGRPYEPAISPRLKIVLVLIFASVAVLGASGAYLFTVRVLEWLRGQQYINQFSLWMFLAHVVVGVVIVGPFLAFGFLHLATARHRKNRHAVRLGIALFITGIAASFTGLALVQLAGLPQLPTGTWSRNVVFALHVLTPIVAVGLYVLHRRAGPDIQWSWGIAWGVAVGGFVIAMSVMHSFDPRKAYTRGSPEGEKYFEPSKARTVDGNFISAEALLMDDYCMKCHADIYNDHVHSAHKFSSFNNPAYLFSILETRRVSNQRDGRPRASRWCAGCHDPVPFFSGAFDEPVFDDPHFDVSKHEMAKAGITCTVCHGIVHVNSRIGNADYTIEEPIHYPFAYSKNPILQWVNQQIVKAKPEFHKRTFLKDFHRTEAFCSTCHKVSVPMEVNHYKEWLRGQDHADSYLLSGVSGVSARSFYSPPVAQTNCNGCHMPLEPSRDFAARDFDGSGERKRHDHLFPGANTGLPELLNYEGKDEIIKAHADFLRGKDSHAKSPVLRIDLFGLKDGGTIDGTLHAPLRAGPLPKLQPGQTYLVEVVIRTLSVGHPFTQGTADSNEVWVDFEARSGERLLGRSGALKGEDETGPVDEWAHFLNILMLDRNGNRIDRRNPQDIFTPLYNHQIPPGAGQVVHYKLEVPKDVTAAVRLKARVRYRKFDYPYMQYVYKQNVPKLPITDLCEDEILLPVAGVAEAVPAQVSPIKPAWQRWNDYGIGCLLEGGVGSKKGELRQAREAFQMLVALPDKDAHAHGYLNSARVAFAEGLLSDAVTALNHAQNADPPAPWWTVAWFNGLVNAQNGHLDEAIADFEKILDPKNQIRERKFDFRRDYVVINELGTTLFRRAQQEADDSPERQRLLRRAIDQYQATLAINPEDLDAHYGLAQCYTLLGGDLPAATETVAPTRDALTAAGQAFARPTETHEARLRAAANLNQALARYGELPSRPDQPKLPALIALIGQCRRAYEQTDDLPLRSAAAHLLGVLHRQAHAIYKPDDVAAGRTKALYRKAHPAANNAAEAVVIYPLH